MPIRLGYQCLATDIITRYAFNKDGKFLDSPDFSPCWFRTIKATAESGHLIKQFPCLLSVLAAFPEWAMSRLSPDMMLILKWQQVNPPFAYDLTLYWHWQNLVCEIQTIIANRERKVDVQDGELPRTIFQTLLNSDLPPKEKSLDRVTQEAQVIIGAGSDTVANALTVTTFHILNNPEVLVKLKQELETAMPDRSAPTKLSIVERLPYLVSVSLSINVTERSPLSCSPSDLDLRSSEAAGVENCSNIVTIWTSRTLIYYLYR